MKYENVVKMEEKFSDIYVYFYNQNKVKECKKVALENYFFIKIEDEDEAKDIISEMERNPKYPMNETNFIGGYKSIYGEKLLKIIPNKFEFWKIRKLMWENNIKTYEAKMSVYLKFLLEHDIKFTEDRRIGILDIETAFGENREGLDVDNTPMEIEILNIYDYLTDTYYVFYTNKKDEEIDKSALPPNVELFSFKTEKEMMLNFIHKFRQLNFDLIFGWNVENYDFAYLLNRCRKIDIDIQDFTNYNGDKQVECRKVFYKNETKIFYDIAIPGIDIVDLIDVMKKANAYSEKPASFSLKSTANFYLKDEKKGEHGSTLFEYLKYNIQDVRLVKLLCDKYELKTFLMGIHLEMANGVPLKHCTHNSIVILYKIKQMFKNIIIPDQIDSFDYDGMKYPFKDYNLKITAAKVLTPTSGIFNRVVFFDFKSLYPSIIRTWNISPDTIFNSGNNAMPFVEIKDIDMNVEVEEKKKIKILKHINETKNFRLDTKGIYPQLCEYLVNRRLIFQKEARRIKKEKGVDNFEYKSFAYKDDNQKQVLNSIFGVGSYEHFELYNPYVAAAITAIGRNLLTFINDYVKAKNWVVCLGDTDSCAIAVPNDITDEDLTIELNNALKEYVLKTWPSIKENYCLIFEHQKSMKKFIMKEAKKRYFGFQDDGTFICKGFSIVQHSTPTFIKEVLTNIFKDFLNSEDSKKIKENLVEYKKVFKTLSPDEIGISLRIDKKLEEYEMKVPHIEASKYSNKYLGTNLTGNDVGKFIFVKNMGSKKYPITKYVMLGEDTKLPAEFIIDWEKMWDKLVLDPLDTLSEVKDLNIESIINKNKTLGEFIK
jgi:DNA polymerase I